MTTSSFDPFGPELSPVVLATLVGLIWLYLRGAARPRLLRERVSTFRHLFGPAALSCRSKFSFNLLFAHSAKTRNSEIRDFLAISGRYMKTRRDCGLYAR